MFVIAHNSPSLMGTEPGPIKAISTDEKSPKNEYKATGPLYGQLCLYSIVSNSPRADFMTHLSGKMHHDEHVHQGTLREIDLYLEYSTISGV